MRLIAVFTINYASQDSEGWTEGGGGVGGGGVAGKHLYELAYVNIC